MAGLTRRALIQISGATALGALAAPALVGCAGGRGPSGSPRWPNGRDPFSLGVAAGDPAPDGFVLWTRLAPEPLSYDPAAPGGLTGPAVPVAYEIATDPA